MLQIVLPPLLGLISFVVISVGGFLMLLVEGGMSQRKAAEKAPRS
jgi:hypothetical protein